MLHTNFCMYLYVSWFVSQNHFVCQQFVDDFLRNYQRTTFQIGSILTDSFETIYQNSIISLLTLHDLSIMLDFLHFPSITSKKMSLQTQEAARKYFRRKWNKPKTFASIQRNER